MITYSFDRDHLSLLIRRSELPELAGELRKRLEALGLSAWADVEAELFCGRDEVLVIARPLSPLCVEKAPPPLRLRRR